MTLIDRARRKWTSEWKNYCDVRNSRCFQFIYSTLLVSSERDKADYCLVTAYQLCQDQEEDRIDFVKATLWEYINGVSQNCLNDDEVK